MGGTVIVASAVMHLARLIFFNDTLSTTSNSMTVNAEPVAYYSNFLQ
jgi:hypothetical protein